MEIGKLEVEELEDIVTWAKELRRDRRMGKMSEKVIKKLDGLCFVWDEKQSILRSVFDCSVEVVDIDDVSNDELLVEWEELPSAENSNKLGEKNERH